MSENSLKKTLYVGNLSASVSEELLNVYFSRHSAIKSIVFYKRSSFFAFVEYYEHEGAAATLAAMNGQMLHGRKLKIEWASDSNRRKDFVIFVGDLCPSIDAVKLKEAFSTFGEISHCKIIVDLETLKSRKYGFVYFIDKGDALKAISEMNGQYLGSRRIRTNWAKRTRKDKLYRHWFYANESGYRYPTSASPAYMNANNANQSAAVAEYPYVYSQPMSYWDLQAYAEYSQMNLQQGMVPHLYEHGQFVTQMPTVAWQEVPAYVGIPFSPEEFIVADQGFIHAYDSQTMMAHTMPEFQNQCLFLV